jgi:muramidase (phage lysozyme)
LAKKPKVIQDQWLGMTKNVMDRLTLIATQQPDFAGRYAAELRSIQQAGITDKLAKDITGIDQNLTLIDQHFNTMVMGAEGKFEKAFQTPIENFKNWLVANEPAIDAALDQMANALKRYSDALVQTGQAYGNIQRGQRLGDAAGDLLGGGGTHPAAGEKVHRGAPMGIRRRGAGWLGRGNGPPSQLDGVAPTVNGVPVSSGNPLPVTISSDSSGFFSGLMNSLGLGGMFGGGAGGGAGGSGGRGGGGNAPADISTTAANKDLSAEQRAFLDLIASGESGKGGAYNIQYGGGHFSSYADHPGGTAAGRYQDLPSTWAGLKRKYGIADFSPKNQDIGNWHLAEDDYRKRTGRDLIQDIQAGNWGQIKSGLQGTWVSWAGYSAEDMKTAFQRALGRENETAPMPARPLFPNVTAPGGIRIGVPPPGTPPTGMHINPLSFLPNMQPLHDRPAVMGGHGGFNANTTVNNTVSVSAPDPQSAAAMVGLHLDRTGNEIARNLQGAFQ